MPLRGDTLITECIAAMPMPGTFMHLGCNGK
jgi:hypothetical protein